MHEVCSWDHNAGFLFIRYGSEFLAMAYIFLFVLATMITPYLSNVVGNFAFDE
jgi:hypothetical protein